MSRLLSRWWRAVAALEHVGAEAGELRQRIQSLEHALLNQRIRVELQGQALTRAEADVRYWRERAERFIDQIALKGGIIAMPTMTEPEPVLPTSVDSLLGTFGVSEINTKKTPSGAATAVLGVNAADAQAAVADLLERTGAH